MKNKKNIFAGENAVRDFLNPGALGPLPVVELPKSLNPFHEEGVRIFIKLMQFVPLSNIKSFPAHAMLSALSKEKLSRTKNLVEYSSGNTVLSLTILGRHFGIPNMHAVITPDVPLHKKRLLQLVGANLLISHGPPSPDVWAEAGGVYEAKKLGEKSGWHNLHQYINPANQKAAEEHVGKEIWKQFGAKLSVFMASIGTAGTIAGAGPYILKKNSKAKIWGTAIESGSSVPGPRGESAIHKLAFPWEKCVHEVIAVDELCSFRASLDLIRQGFFVGPSTGMQLSGINKKIREYKRKGKLDELRNKNGEIVVCFVACDTMFPYIDDYFSVLPEKLFPKIKDLS
ncbi:MAG TPA: pyridoxal-phosphate dependent enzyme [Candidatus Paceibacterota bacterium]|nr:pyridoxal-phosphate dependent enzyme [Candidatus Paceibacterota bacterium]